jgi:FkbM family methyltransferase
MIKTIAKRILPQQLISYIQNSRGVRYTSFSQEGEDMILRNIFRKKIINGQPGFYVDVGAHHPVTFSNTNYFYQIGWRGVNIDAMPNSMDLFSRSRKRDINVEVAIASKPANLTFYSFNEPALNTFSKDLADERLKVPKFKLLNTTEIQTQTLEKVLEQNLPENQHIDFLSVDVEGFDLDVLKSNNWIKYRPTAVLVESYANKFDQVVGDPGYQFLKEKNYDLLSKTVNTLIFVDGQYSFELY